MATVVKTTFKLKRADSTKWLELNPILAAGEPGFEKDTGKLKIGNGTDSWINLPYVGENGLTEEEIKALIKAAAYDDTDVYLAINKALEEAKKYADNNDADTIYDDTAVYEAISAAEQRAKQYADDNEKDTVYDDTALKNQIVTLEDEKAPKTDPTFSHSLTFSTTFDDVNSVFSMNRWGAHLDKKGCHSATLGYANVAQAEGSVALGYFTWATGQRGQTVAGRFNKKDNIGNAMFVVGAGSSDGARHNVFRVDNDGSVFAGANYGANGADFAEYFEWLDGNPNNEDRRGRFVTLVGDKIAFAAPDDEILGVVSAIAAYIGNTAHEDWQGKYKTDIFGEKLIEYIEVPAVIDPETNEIMVPAHIAPAYVINPEYNPEEEYIPRSERKEWTVVGLVGQITMVDDGTCVVGGKVKPGINGIGTISNDNTGYRVMKRLDENHIKVLVK